MNKQEAAKLLSLIKLAYPASYRDMDRLSAEATVQMWAKSFESVPYGLVEKAFDTHRMESKFPPTVAEMAAQIRKIHNQACNAVQIHKNLGNRDMVRHFRRIAACTDMDAGKLSLTGGSMGKLEVPEHPEIRWALETGYPRDQQERRE